MTPIRPDRWSYFPPVQIFGRNIIPLYNTSSGPAVPLDEVARAIGVSASHALKVLSRQRDLVDLHVAGAPEPLPADRSLNSCRDSLCLGMDGIALIILGSDPDQVVDDLGRQRLVLAKKWLLLQLGNRLKTPGRKNQPRWDSGLDKKQVRELKKLFDGLSPQKTVEV